MRLTPRIPTCGEEITAEKEAVRVARPLFLKTRSYSLTVRGRLSVKGGRGREGGSLENQE